MIYPMGRLARGFAAAAAVALVSLPALGAAAREEEQPRCRGRLAEIVGTDGDDTLRGTPGRDVIWGGGGDDVILASLGNDLVCGGPGADLIHGGRGNDVVDGGAGDGDQAIGDLGDDKVVGGPGDGDEAAGDLGIDIVNGGPGDRDVVHGDYGYDRMSGGAGRGDVATFATAVASGRGAGVHVSLAAHRARGDGHDTLVGFEALEGSAFADVLIGRRRGEAIDGGPGDDRIFGGGGHDRLDGGQGSDRCRGAKGRAVSCGRERPPRAPTYVALDPAPGGGAGLQLIGGGGRDDVTVAFDEATGTFEVGSAKGIAIGPGCAHPGGRLKRVACAAGGPARWLMADLGPGDDRLLVDGSLAAVGSVRFAGGLGDDVLRGGPEDDLIESGPGGDSLYGGAGADGLVGGLPGPTSLYGGTNGDLLAAGGGCAGGRLVGGPGRDDASFAETPAHPGRLVVSFPRGIAYVDVVRGCDPVRLSRTNEDMEGSFDDDVLVGDGRANSILGQPGSDRLFGGGGDDVIDARDGGRDAVIRCGRRRAAGRALTDPFDPAPRECAAMKQGRPVPGLNR